MKHFSRTDCPVVVIDEESFNELQKKAELNNNEVEDLAFKKYSKLIENDGLDIKIHINNDCSLMYERTKIVGMDNWEEQVWSPHCAKGIINNIKSDIVYDLVKEANKLLEPEKENIVNNSKQFWEKKIKKLKKEVSFWRNMSLCMWIVFFIYVFRELYIMFDLIF